MSEPFASIASYLPRMAEQQPHALAIVCPDGRDRHGKARYTHYTYAQLDAQSDLIARGLAAVGIGRGVRTVLMVRPSLEFFALTFALLKRGAVPVMVDPGIGLSSLKTCLAEAAPEAFIGVPMAHAARVVLGWGRSTLQTHVTVDGAVCGEMLVEKVVGSDMARKQLNIGTISQELDRDRDALAGVGIPVLRNGADRLDAIADERDHCLAGII